MCQKYDVFEKGAIRHASLFTKLLLNTADYVQIKCNSNVAEAIQTMEVPDFKCLEMSQMIYKKDETQKRNRNKTKQG